ncbi:Tn7-like element transposition protein TnsE [Clostridium gasigenes]|uniref:TnsE C-terminal domain-containing protein n=1 Tax=Clostridium gasigenes TaxID=94869 RepID=A0A7X0SD48_9CLOT|nr:Tn7-like element transposition protein TnsE [Clostridium gasigenes]MBB6715374.1 hypothetical protein [Clostridium gasigenes]
MGKESVIIKNWPFEKGEKVKLTWIGEPFKQSSKWMVYAYFKGTRATRRIILDWASIHFLSLEKYYTNGNLSNGETQEDIEVIDINLSGIKAEYKEKDWNIRGSGFNLKTKSKTFNFYKNGSLYSMPIIEIIRAVLAPDKFLLNRVVEMDSLENFFAYELTGNKLDIHFTSEYEAKLLSSEKVNHLAWIITNSNIFKMFNSIGQSLWEKRELKFDCLFDVFNINARIEKRDNYVRILQILSLSKKKINIEEVNVFHPSLEKSQLSDATKKVRQFVSKGNEDKELEANVDGATKESEMMDTFLISHEYEKTPVIHRKKSGRKIKRKKGDENTKTYIIEGDNLRTTADTGGEDIIKGIEFANLSKVEEKGELRGFIEVLKLLEKRQAIKSVDIIIDNLPEGAKGRKFSRLSNGLTKRKYAIGKVVMVDGRKLCLIEIEREERALSMIIVKVNISVNWGNICSIMLLGLVNESGKWSNDIIEKVEKQGGVIIRKKHIRKSIQESARQIYEKLVCL